MKQQAPLAVGALLGLVGLWQAWSGWQLSAAHALEVSIGERRSALAAELGKTVQAATAQLDKRRQRVNLVSAVRDGRMDDAKAVLQEGWKEAEAVEFHSPDLAEAYADPAAFGYGKLAALESALQVEAAHARLAVEGKAPKLVVAAQVMDEGRLLALAYARLPAAPLLDAVKAAEAEGGYLALRQGANSVAESGDSALAKSAEAGAIAIEGSELRVVAAAPLVLASPLGGYGEREFMLAGVLIVLGAGLVGYGLRRKSAPEAASKATAEATGPTLAELQQTGQLATPEPQAPAKRVEKAAAPKIALERSIFRAYDIRGVVGQTLDTSVARLIGQAIGSLMHEKGTQSIAVGRDGRLSSPDMAGALIEGLRQAGREVIDIGEAATPIAYFAAFHLRTGSCVSVTGSHNPPDYNGFKIVVDGETLAGEAIQKLYERIAENRLHSADSPGSLERRDIGEDYIQRIAGDIQLERKLRVVVDCGSGVPGAIAPRLLEAIGAEVEPLFCEVDGTFPHHHPDPSDPANLQDLINVVKRVKADLGIALDGDGDRLGVVTAEGEVIFPDRLLMLFAADVLDRNPGASVIYDVKCTGHLAAHILRHGGSPLMWKTGHSLIKAKMRETEAELAGEMSGHFFFRERWYGFDDGLYAAARLLEILAANTESPSAVLGALPKGVSTPELKVSVEEGEQYRFVDQFVAQARFEGARIATIDGLRADWPDGWGLVRASNTTPTLVMRFDARDAEALQRVQSAFREQLLAVKPDLVLPF